MNDFSKTKVLCIPELRKCMQVLRQSQIPVLKLQFWIYLSCFCFWLGKIRWNEKHLCKWTQHFFFRFFDQTQTHTKKGFMWNIFVWNVSYSTLTLLTELYEHLHLCCIHDYLLIVWYCLHFPLQMFYFILFILFHKMFPWCKQHVYHMHIVYLINLKE